MNKSKLSIKDDEFSRFFRETSPEEQKKVLGEAVRKSTEDQRRLIEEYDRLSREGKIKISNAEKIEKLATCP
ncbi:MAG: hypothetical protein ACREBW_07245 [Candidatus Micrarchaeaceae archaeon]